MNNTDFSFIFIIYILFLFLGSWQIFLYISKEKWLCRHGHGTPYGTPNHGYGYQNSSDYATACKSCVSCVNRIVPDNAG